MKTITSQLKAHLGQDVTSVCTCWRIQRRDGTVLGFTDHDQDIVYNGVTYIAHTGYTRTAIQNDAKFTVDNMEVEGILDSTYIDEHDLRNGVYNYADVWIFGLNWRDTSQGIIPWRRGKFGEVTVMPTGSFKTELRGLSQLLSNSIGNFVSPTCRADLGDSKCKIPLDPPVWSANTVIKAGSWIKVNFGDALPDDPYRGLIWYCANGGTTGSSMPAFSTSPTTDGTCSWVSYNSFTKQGYVTGVGSRKVFQVAGISIPASGLYGPNVNALGQSFPVTGLTLAGHGFPTGTPTNQITLHLTTQHGNNVHYNSDVPGSGLLTYEHGNGTPDVLLEGTWEILQAIVTQGITFQNSATQTDILTMTASDTQGHSASQSIAVPQNEHYYDGSTIWFVSGPNAGYAMEVYTYANGTVTLWLSMPFVPQVGDAFRIYPGCDRTRAKCLLFGNVVNFRGEPDLPGQDFLYSANLSF